MRFLAAALLSLCIALPAAAATTTTAPAPDARMMQAYKFEQSGWTYVHLEGSPEQIGFQHGSLLKSEIEETLKVFQVEGLHDFHHSWTFFREKAKTILWPHIEPEYQAELTGIAEGLAAQGSKLDVWDVVAMNGDTELTEYYLPIYNKQMKKPNPPKAVAPGKCSAFIATGSATRDGKIVIAHSNWSPYAEGEHWTIVFDIAPAKGYHMFMDGLPGVITSQDDFGVNSAGLMITETTLPAIEEFDVHGIPEFVRSRKAMQYAGSIDEYVAIMRKGNNGGYANSWMIGDRKTGEIAYLELALHNTPLKRSKDGYFVSSNFAADPKLIKEDTEEFDPKDMSSSMNARHLRADQFMQEHLGKIDTTLAEAYLSDHYDSYSKVEDRGVRSLCGHEDLSKRGEPVWADEPYDPGGAVTGKVMDSDMAAKMSFIGRAGHPCGEDFLVAPFLARHPQFAWQKPILGDMKAGPWTTFTSGEQAPAAAAVAGAE